MFSNFKNFFNELSEFKRFRKLEKEKKEVIFYAENKSQWDFFEDTISHLLKKNIPICYVSSSNTDINLKRKIKNFNCFYIGSKSIRTIFFSVLNTKIIISSLPDLDKYEIKRSKYKVKYIFIPHNVLSTHMVFRKGAFDAFDIFFCSGPHHLKEIKETENIDNLKKKTLIKFGCSRIDKIIKNFKNTKKKKKNIRVLIAPSWRTNGLFETGAEKLINHLKKKYIITLRPHPDTLRLNKNCIENLLNKFKDNKNIMYSPKIESIQNYFDNDILISDWSGAAFEFAFGTLKPVIFLDLPRKINNPDYLKFKNKPIEINLRNQIGRVINSKSYNKIPELINDFIKKRNFWKKKILSIRNKQIYNIKNSGKIGADCIQNLLQKN